MLWCFVLEDFTEQRRRFEKMITFSLQSGSNGNSLYVECKGVRLLFDAGISGKRAESRMTEHGREIRNVDGLIISHDHQDHIRCAGIYQRKFNIPLYITEPTYHVARHSLGTLEDVRFFHSGDPLDFGSIQVSTIRTPHDGEDGVCFVVEGDGKRLGIFTDLGHPFKGLEMLLGTLDAAYLEANYDPDMLATGRYPELLQERIRGNGGHLSNFETAKLLDGVDARCLRWVALAHLSEENNQPELASQTVSKTVGTSLPVYLTSRYAATPVFEL